LSGKLSSMREALNQKIVRIQLFTLGPSIQTHQYTVNRHYYTLT
jgi:hypothetical protein